MKKIGIAGCTGRVGALLVEELQSGRWSNFELAAGSVREYPPKNLGYLVTKNSAELFEKSDIVIDFTSPAATLGHAKLAAEQNKILITGTTGLSTQQEQKLAGYAAQATIVYAANMSVGVNLLLALIEEAAKRLDPEDWDIEIFESHHKHKVDAPSGTALAIGKAAAAGRGVDLDVVSDRARDGVTGPRKTGQIGFSVARGGDVVGDHTAFFYGEGERLELTHKATNRMLFARGALKAAKWATSQKPGLYSMRDILDI